MDRIVTNKLPNFADNVVTNAVRLVYSYICRKNPNKDNSKVRDELLRIACVEGFDCIKGFVDDTEYSYSQVQNILSKINEKEGIRKSKGVYYTPNDVVHFILSNSIKSAFGILADSNIHELDLSAIPIDDFCRLNRIFDPTCGAGEFLLATLELKFTLLKNSGMVVSESLVKEIISTIYGNDVNKESVIITELRLFLCIAEMIGIEYCIGLGNIMNRRFTSYDFVTEVVQPDLKFNVIVGNPPYVEDFKSGLSLKKKYGNIYANVLINAAERLEENGAMGFIIPLSYIATPRMRLLREELGVLVPEQYILSYADRPDCLFDSVHQKLCVLIGNNKSETQTIYTGNYQYWYKEERPLLFKNTSVVHNVYKCNDFIPKLGTKLDVAIYEKVTDKKTTLSIYDVSRQGSESVYLNRREAFWMKAYRTRVDDPEYKVYSFATVQEADFCYCIINSSLFWWYWICVSDCWHVSKALNNFRMPATANTDDATNLASLLIDKLEATKVYVGTKQTQYEYKHRECLEEIYAIDDFINAAYGLTESESEYIKSFAIRYRTSGGIDADESN